MVGEKTKLPPPRVFSCPSCGAQLKILAQGLTLSVACGSCAAVVDAENENAKILSKAEYKFDDEPVIPIGSRGVLRGRKWEVIGFMTRVDEASDFRWGEYLLFNPKYGFCWLTESNGHWSLVTTVHGVPKVNYDVEYRGKSYRYFHNGRARVRFVLGEFYWRVKVGDTVKVSDYTRPPELLSMEESDDEKTWSLSTYLPIAELKKAFKDAKNLPTPIGVAANQPGFMGQDYSKLLSMVGIMMALLVVIQLVTLIIVRPQSSFRQDFSFIPGTTTETFVSEPFVFPGRSTSAVDVQLTADVQNNWFAAEMALVDEQSGEKFEFDQGAEYYSGYDGGESWSEGSRTANFTISKVPPGNYRLTVKPAGVGDVNQPVKYNVWVRWSVRLWSNFWLGFVLMFTIPMIMIVMRIKHETTRWNDSSVIH